MYRDQPPCNTCAKHDCRSCAWTSPLDASYRRFIPPRSVVSLAERPACSAENRIEPCWLAAAARRFARLFSDSSRPH
jgi:hypothetical protein